MCSKLAKTCQCRNMLFLWKTMGVRGTWIQMLTTRFYLNTPRGELTQTNLCTGTAKIPSAPNAILRMSYPELASPAYEDRPLSRRQREWKREWLTVDTYITAKQMSILFYSCIFSQIFHLLIGISQTHKSVVEIVIERV